MSVCVSWWLLRWLVLVSFRWSWSPSSSPSSVNSVMGQPLLDLNLDNTSPTTTSSSSESTLVTVDCPSSLGEFRALTEMVLEGRSQFLNILERKLLKGEFMNIYNSLTIQNCDSFHRKIQVVDFVNMSNTLGDVWTAQDMINTTLESEILDANESQLLEEYFANNTAASIAMPQNAQTPPNRQLQELQTSVNQTQTQTQAGDSPNGGGVTVTYEVTGSCRDCPTTESGSFELYDDAFRRRRLTKNHHYNQQYYSRGQLRIGTSTVKVKLRTKLLWVRALQQDINNNITNDNDNDTKTDCVCVQGVEPTPQAPGVQECVDLMNQRIPNVQAETGLLQDVILTNLIQLDDLSSLQNLEQQPQPQSQSEENIGDGVSVVQKESPGTSNALDFKIWSRSGNPNPNPNPNEKKDHTNHDDPATTSLETEELRLIESMSTTTTTTKATSTSTITSSSGAIKRKSSLVLVQSIIVPLVTQVLWWGVHPLF